MLAKCVCGYVSEIMFWSLVLTVNPLPPLQTGPLCQVMLEQFQIVEMYFQAANFFGQYIIPQTALVKLLLYTPLDEMDRL